MINRIWREFWNKKL